MSTSINFKRKDDTTSNILNEHVELETRPCDCDDFAKLAMIECSGISHNDYTLEVRPRKIIISIKGMAEITMPMLIFKKFAEWYLEPQKHVK